MLKEPIYITAISSISALGDDQESIWESYKADKHCFIKEKYSPFSVWVSKLEKSIRDKVDDLRHSNSKYKSLDDSVLFVLYAARMAMVQADWNGSSNFGINIGSSRGATSIFEKQHGNFLNDGSVSSATSPSTTLGNISSWVAHDLQTNGPVISHSITCSTALHALLNGIAWIQGGLADKFMVGGAEAPLTPFTIAQMKALKIYSDSNGEWPCRALDLDKKENTLVLGEAASIACIEKNNSDRALAEIIGIGYATEPLDHGASLSTNAICFQDSMKMALTGFTIEQVDAIVMHAPGTIKGDVSEYNAIEAVFGDHIPMLTTNKWKAGHTFGASGMLSVEMAILMLQHQKFIPAPFYDQQQERELKHILVNAVGFGGNAVSILLKAPNSSIFEK